MSPAILIPISAPPPSPAPKTSETAKPHHHLPKPLLRLEFRDLSHAGSRAFLSSSDPIILLTNALSHVFTHLYHAHAFSSPDSAQQNDASHVHYAVPQTRSVTLVLRSMPGVAYTTGLELDDAHKEIHLSLDYIANVASARRHAEIQGVLTHEMVHCLQWNGLGTAPGGLIEGVADWVRLRAGLEPPHWRREAKGSWDCGYQGTGWFLDWLEGRFGAGFVGRCNEGLRGRRYVEREFWGGLCEGATVEGLWEEYGRWLEKRGDGEGSDGSDGHGKHRGKKGRRRDRRSKKPERDDAQSSSSEDDRGDEDDVREKPKKEDNRQSKTAKPGRDDAQSSSSEDKGHDEDDVREKHRPKKEDNRKSKTTKPGRDYGQTSSSEDDRDDVDDGDEKHTSKKDDQSSSKTANPARDNSPTSSSEDDPIIIEKEDAMNERQ